MYIEYIVYIIIYKLTIIIFKMYVLYVTELNNLSIKYIFICGHSFNPGGDFP